MPNHRGLFCVLVLLLATNVVVQADEIDDFIRAQMKSQNIPGLALAVVKNGEIIKTAGYGLANTKLKVPVAPETVFHIGSEGAKTFSLRKSLHGWPVTLEPRREQALGLEPLTVSWPH